ncbi:hypothetical protein CLV38_12927 [Alkalibacterium olivapovliticus]|uniref:Uncharacterized protein n=1 Tax=Alkalibacterium olivapovliticus TaxID=99907 RepID=A0A2T0VY61_9LACT|nr:hypothetical protein CLV38_12927 [Alkalibacterium olivapovliticus]
MNAPMLLFNGVSLFKPELFIPLNVDNYFY